MRLRFRLLIIVLLTIQDILSSNTEGHNQGNVIRAVELKLLNRHSELSENLFHFFPQILNEFSKKIVDR